MLKVRLMGTKNDIKWFGKILQRNSKIEVTEFSDLYPNKGTKKFYRAYVEVKKTNVGLIGGIIVLVRIIVIFTEIIKVIAGHFWTQCPKV